MLYGVVAEHAMEPQGERDGWSLMVSEIISIDNKGWECMAR